MGYFELYDGETLVVKASNLITTAGEDSLTNALIESKDLAWEYMALGLGSSAPGSAQTTLDEEIERQAFVGAWSPGQGTVRLLAVFGKGVGNGHIREIGIYDQAATRTVLHSCDVITNWSSDGSLSQETTTIMQGAASIQCDQLAAGSVAFENSSLASGTINWGDDDYLQLWYRCSYDVGTVTVRLGNDASNYHEWDFVPGTVDSFVHMNQKIGSATEVGTPLTPYDYFHMSHGTAGTAFTEYLDKISLYRETGTLLARGTVDATKTANTIYNGYYKLKIT